MSDRITLTLPRARPYFGIAHLVLGGLAARLDLTYEHLEDLQLALAGVLDGSPLALDEVVVSVAVEDGTIVTRVGPFDDARLREQLAREPAGEDEVGLGRLLRTVADDVEVAADDAGAWLTFAKRVGERAA